MTPRIRLAIVDDEPLARERVRHLLRNARDVEIVGEAANGREGLALVEREQPDVVVLDINMPEVDGLRMMEALDDPPAVIFATAYEHHAVRAFELEAVDYLLKPFNSDRLQRALDRVRRQFALRRSAEGEPEPRHIRAENGRDIELLDPDRISVARIEEGVVFLLRDDGERLVFAGTLQELEEQLPPEEFPRASRKALVNRRAVESYRAVEEGGLRLKLRGGHEETVSRRRARVFRTA